MYHDKKYFRLFCNQAWGAIHAVGGLATLHLPDFGIFTLQSLLTFITEGEVTVPSTVLSEFTTLTTLLEIANVAEQVSISSVGHNPVVPRSVH